MPTSVSGGQKGVLLGSPARPLPRASALYDRKTKWALKDEGDSLHGDWTTNYSSLKGHEEKVSAQYDAEVKDGLMTKISLGEALDRFGANLIIAATGAIAKTRKFYKYIINFNLLYKVISVS